MSDTQVEGLTNTGNEEDMSKDEDLHMAITNAVGHAEWTCTLTLAYERRAGEVRCAVDVPEIQGRCSTCRVAPGSGAAKFRGKAYKTTRLEATY
jgi:hypothetical protein